LAELSGVLADQPLDGAGDLRQGLGMDHRDIVDLEPHGTPPPISAGRRLACFVLGIPLAVGALYLFTAPKFWGLGFVMAMMLTGGAAVLIGTALFPKLTFQHFDRSRWR
jgi:hypothetical protein